MTWIDKNIQMPADRQDVTVLCSDGKEREAFGAHLGSLKGFLVDMTDAFSELGNGEEIEVTHWKDRNSHD